MDAFSIVDGDDALGFVELDEEIDDDNYGDDETESNPEPSRVYGEIEPTEEGE